MHKIYYIIFALFTFQISLGQSVLVEEQNFSNGANIAFKKYKLPNGLVFILHENKNFGDLVSVSVDYHVGSSRELQNEKGIAHFMEQYLKLGSTNFTKEEINTIYTTSSTEFKSTITKDITRFQSVFPSDWLENILHIESDRLGFSEIKSDKISKNKFKQYEDLNTVSQRIYPKNHPYYSKDLFYTLPINDKLKKLKQFKNRWYGANNVVVSIVGDFKEIDAIGIMEKYFQNLPVCPPVFKDIQVPLSQLEEKVLINKNHKETSLSVVFPTSDLHTEEYIALDAALFCFANSIESPLQDKLINSGFANRIFTKNNVNELAGDLNIRINTSNESSLLVVESLYKASKSHFKKYGVSIPLLEAYKRNANFKILKNKENIKQLAQHLSFGETMFKNPNYLAGFENIINSLRPSQIELMVDKYFKNELYIANYPTGKAENWRGISKYKSPKNIKRYEAAYKPNTQKKRTDLFDRSKKNEPSITEKKYNLNYKIKTKKGRFTVVETTNGGSKFNRIDWYFPAGKNYERLDNKGVSDFLTYVFKQGSKNRSTKETYILFEKIGIKYNVINNNNHIKISVVTPPNFTNEALAIVYEIVNEPNFSNKVIDSYKKRNVEVSKSLDLNLAKEFYRTQIGSENATLVYGGKLPFKTYKKDFSDWLKIKKTTSSVLQNKMNKMSFNGDNYMQISFNENNSIFNQKTLTDLLNLEFGTHFSWFAKNEDKNIKIYSKRNNQISLDELLNKIESLKSLNFTNTTISTWIKTVKNRIDYSFNSLDEKQEKIYSIARKYPKSKKYNKIDRSKTDSTEINRNLNTIFTASNISWSLNNKDVVLKNKEHLETYKELNQLYKPTIKTRVNTKLYKGKEIPVIKESNFKKAYKKAKILLKNSTNKFFYWSNKVYKIS